MQTPRSGSGYVTRPIGQPFAAHATAMLRAFLQRSGSTDPSSVRLVTNVTTLTDEQITILTGQADAAGVTLVLVDDGARPRPATARSRDLAPHELAMMVDQATAARCDRDARSPREQP